MSSFSISMDRPPEPPAALSLVTCLWSLDEGRNLEPGSHEKKGVLHVLCNTPFVIGQTSYVIRFWKSIFYKLILKFQNLFL